MKELLEILNKHQDVLSDRPGMMKDVIVLIQGMQHLSYHSPIGCVQHGGKKYGRH